MQAVEDFEDALLQRRAAHDRVVDDDEVVFVGPQRAVSDVIDVGGQIVALVASADERTELDVLPHHFLYPHIVVQLADAVGHTVKSHLGGVGDVGEDRVGYVAADGLHDGRRQLLAQALALLVDVTIRAAAEVNALEAARRQLLRGQDLLQMALAVLADDEGLAGL